MQRLSSSLVSFLPALALSLVLVDAYQIHTTAYAGTHAGVASYIQQAGMPATLPLTGPGGTSRSHLPSSAMPHNDSICSVTSNDTPPQCSTAASINPCSAHCKSQQSCSAFSETSFVIASCSTRSSGGCSVIPPKLGGGRSFCSASNDGTAFSVMCSVIAVGKKQSCTAQNPGGGSDTCSVGRSAECSVFGGGSADSNFCSVFSPAAKSKTCSAYDNSNSTCSILRGNKGICTNLKGAASGTCSAQVAGAVCSTFGGGLPSPGTRCRG